MDPLRELPMGFGMALLQNREAADYYNSLNATQRKAVLDQVYQVESASDMTAFVERLGKQEKR